MHISSFSLVLLIFLLVQLEPAYGQKKTYLDRFHEETQKKHAVYVQTIKRSGKKYLLQEKLLSIDRILVTQELSQVNPRVIEGETKRYFENGQLKETGSYADNKRTGVWKTFYKNGQVAEMGSYVDNKRAGVWNTFYENGQLKEAGSYTDDKPQGVWEQYRKNGQIRSKYVAIEANPNPWSSGGSDYLQKFLQYWDKDGAAILKNGNGILEEENPNNRTITTTVFKDSLSLYSINSKNDTIFSHLTVDKAATYEGGPEMFYKDVVEATKYPAQARRMSIQGVVYVQFIVNEDGDLQDVKAIKGIGAGCDEAAEKAVLSTSAKWEAAEFEGRKVKVSFIVPANFRLGQ